jgi:hypothetical protein
MMSEWLSASLDFYRDLRDAISEALFYQIYGGLFSLYLADRHESEERQEPVEARQLPVVKAALASISKGGYPEAVARVFALLAHDDVQFPLERLHLKYELAQEFAHLLPDMARDQQRRIRGEQDIIVRYEPACALETLPLLLSKPADRTRLRVLLERLLTHKGVAQLKPPEQVAMLKQIHKLLTQKAPTAPPPTATPRRHIRPKSSRALQPA